MPNFTDYISEKKKSLTPLEKNEGLRKNLGIENLYLKREDQNEFGSFKSRALAYQVSCYKNLGHKSLVISSSGNAAICAAKYCDLAGIKLFCFISPQTDLGKKAALAETSAIVIETNRAIRFASYVSAKYKIPNLRPSIDDLSLIGFETISFEIYEQFLTHSLQFTAYSLNIFTFVTSGSSFIGIYNGFKKLFDFGFITKIPKMFAVMSDEISLGVKNSRRIENVFEIVKITGGQVVNIANADLKTLEDKCLDLSRQIAKESQAVLVAILQTKINNVIAIIGGKNWELNAVKLKKNFLTAETFEKVDQIIQNSTFKIQN